MQYYHSQHGRGLAGILGGVVRKAIPFVLPAIAAAGKRALKAGARRLLVKGVQAIDQTSAHPQSRKRKRPIKRNTGQRNKNSKRKPPSKRRKRDALS